MRPEPQGPVVTVRGFRSETNGFVPCDGGGPIGGNSSSVLLAILEIGGEDFLAVAAAVTGAAEVESAAGVSATVPAAAASRDNEDCWRMVC